VSRAASPGVYLRLGRVSNLPTVWTNVLAGAVLAGGELAALPLLFALAGMSLVYTGGMYLNDAFDREVDARERPERPIPSGLVGAGQVFAIGFALLAGGVVATAGAAAASPARGAWWAVPAALLLAGTVVYYDARHKRDPLSPLVMGLCRVLVYVTAALAVAGRLTPAVAGGALVLLAYLIGLTYVAKQETLTEVANLWPLLFLAAPFVYGAPVLARGAAALLYLAFLAWVAYAISLLVRRRPGNIPRAVVTLIAGISLLDALLIVHAGAAALAGWALAGFVLTLGGQRYVAGT
jgi:hypothetical protein